MAQAVVVAMACMGIYSIFLTVRGLIRLYQERELRMLICVAAFFLLAPVLFLLAVDYGDGIWTIWLALPTLLLGICWICTGFFLESFLRRQQKLKLDGRKREIPKAPPHNRRNNLLLLLLSLGIWIFGAFVGIKDATIETCALCICLFLFARAVGALWKYRGF